LFIGQLSFIFRESGLLAFINSLVDNMCVVARVNTLKLYRRHMYSVRSWIGSAYAVIYQLYNALFFLMPKILPCSPYRGRRPQITQTNTRRIHRAWARVDEHIIQETSESSTTEWGYHRYPEVISSCGPHLKGISDSIRHQARTKVTCDVECVARLPAKRRSHRKHEEKQRQRKPLVILIRVSNGSHGKNPGLLTFGTPLFVGSFNAKTTNTSMALAMNSEAN
jgi:hypothetical protein